MAGSRVVIGEIAVEDGSEPAGRAIGVSVGLFEERRSEEAFGRAVGLEGLGRVKRYVRRCCAATTAASTHTIIRCQHL